MTFEKKIKVLVKLFGESQDLFLKAFSENNVTNEEIILPKYIKEEEDPFIMNDTFHLRNIYNYHKKKYSSISSETSVLIAALIECELLDKSILDFYNPKFENKRVGNALHVAKELLKYNPPGMRIIPDESIEDPMERAFFRFAKNDFKNIEISVNRGNATNQEIAKLLLLINKVNKLSGGDGLEFSLGEHTTVNELIQ